MEDTLHCWNINRLPIRAALRVLSSGDEVRDYGTNGIELVFRWCRSRLTMAAFYGGLISLIKSPKSSKASYSTFLRPGMDPDGSNSSDEERKRAAEVEQQVTSGVFRILDALSVTSSCCSSDSAKIIIQKALRQSSRGPIDSETVANVREHQRVRETRDKLDNGKCYKPKGLLRSPNHFPHHSPYQPYVLDDSADNSPPPDERKKKKTKKKNESINEQLETDKREQREVVKKEISKNGKAKDAQSPEVPPSIGKGFTDATRSLKNRHLYKHHDFGDSDHNDTDAEKKSPRKVHIPDAEEVVNILAQIVSEKRPHKAKPAAKRTIITNKSPQEPGTVQPNNHTRSKLACSIEREMEVICQYLKQAKQARSQGEENRRNVTNPGDAIIRGNNKEPLKEPKRENEGEKRSTPSDSSSLNVASEEFKVPLARDIRRQNRVSCKRNEESPPAGVKAKVFEINEEETLLASISSAEDNLHQRKSLRLWRSNTNMPRKVVHIPTFKEVQRKKKKDEKVTKGDKHSKKNPARKNDRPVAVSDLGKQNQRVEEVQPREAITSKPLPKNPYESSNNEKDSYTRNTENVTCQNPIATPDEREHDEDYVAETLSDKIIKTAMENLKKAEATRGNKKRQEAKSAEASTEAAETQPTPVEDETELQEDESEGKESVQTPPTEKSTPSSNHAITHLVNLAENVGSQQCGAFVTNELHVNPSASLGDGDRPVQMARQFRNRRTQTREILELACVHSPAYATLKRYNRSEADIPPEYVTVMCERGAGISGLSYRKNPSQRFAYASDGENGYSSSARSVSNKSVVVLFWNSGLQRDKSQVSGTLSGNDQTSGRNLGWGQEPPTCGNGEPKRDSLQSFEEHEAVCNEALPPTGVTVENPVNCNELHLNLEDLGPGSGGTSSVRSRRSNLQSHQSPVDQLCPERLIISLELKTLKHCDTQGHQTSTKKIEIYNERYEGGNSVVITEETDEKRIVLENPPLRQEAVENQKSSSEDPAPLETVNNVGIDVGVGDCVVDEQTETTSMVVTFVNENRMEFTEDSQRAYERRPERNLNLAGSYVASYLESVFGQVESNTSTEAQRCVNEPEFGNRHGGNTIYEGIFQERSPPPPDMGCSHGFQCSGNERGVNRSHTLNERLQGSIPRSRKTRELAGHEANDQHGIRSAIYRTTSKHSQLRYERESRHCSQQPDHATYLRHNEISKYTTTCSMVEHKERSHRKRTIISSSSSGSSKSTSGLLDASRSQHKHKSPQLPIYHVERMDVASGSRNRIKREDFEKALAEAQHKTARKQEKLRKISHKHSSERCIWHESLGGCVESMTQTSTTTQESRGQRDERLTAKEQKRKAYKLMREIGDKYFLKPEMCDSDEDTTRKDPPKRPKVVTFKLNDSVPRLPVSKHFLQPILCDDDNEPRPSNLQERRRQTVREDYKTVSVPPAGQHFLQPQLCESVERQRPPRRDSSNSSDMPCTSSKAPVRYRRHPDSK